MFEINGIIVTGFDVAFIRELPFFPISLVLKGFCETTTEPQNFFIEL